MTRFDDNTLSKRVNPTESARQPPVTRASGQWRWLAGIGLLICLLSGLMLLSAGRGYHVDPGLRIGIELAAVLFGVIVAAAMLSQFLARRARSDLILGAAYLLGAAGDLIHNVLIATQGMQQLSLPPAFLQELSPVAYFSGRLLMAGLIITAALALPQLGNSPHPRRELRLFLPALLVGGILLTVIAYHLPLPHALQPGAVVARPMDLLGAALFAVALLACWHCRVAFGERMAAWVALSAAINVVAQLGMAFSVHPTESLFSLAQLYKLLGYAVPLLGFSLELVLANTRRREAERQSRLAEQRFRRFTEVASDWLWEMDAELRFCYFSSGFERLSGMPISEVLGRRREDMLLGEPDEAFKAHLLELAAHRPFRDFSYALQGQQCGEIWVAINGDPYFDERGEFAGYIGSGRDVTVQVRAQRMEREQQQHLREMLDTSPVGVAISRLSGGEILFANRRLGSMFDCRTEEIVGRKSGQLYETPAQRDEAIAALQANGQVRDFLVPFVSLTGRRFRALLSLEPIVVNGEPHLLAWLYDLSERLAMEERLRESETQLRHVLDTVLDGIVTIDASGKIHSFNPAAERLFGCAEAEVLGTNITRLMPERFVSAHCEGLARYLSTEASAVLGHPVEVAGLRTDGSEFPMELSIADTVHHGKHLFTGTLRDITERKRAEQALLDNRDALRRLVDERTEKLLEAVNNAEQANRAKSEFLANMSHELRTPMHAILSYSNLGVSRAERAQRDKLTGYFERINGSGQRLLILLDDLLDLSKLEAGHMTFDMASQPLGSIVRCAVDEFAPLAADQALRIETHGIGELKAWCDGQRIGQVVRNLLSNAIKFSAEGTVVHVGVVRCMPSGDGVPWLAVCVADCGVGIPQDELESVFDKFIQSSKTRTGAGGTGLGLAISREIVAGHGGRIWAENNAGGGASFTFTVPMATRERRSA